MLFPKRVQRIWIFHSRMLADAVNYNTQGTTSLRMLALLLVRLAAVFWAHVNRGSRGPPVAISQHIPLYSIWVNLDCVGKAAYKQCKQIETTRLSRWTNYTLSCEFGVRPNRRDWEPGLDCTWRSVAPTNAVPPCHCRQSATGNEYAQSFRCQKHQVEIVRSDVGPYSQPGLVAGFRGIFKASQIE